MSIDDAELLSFDRDRLADDQIDPDAMLAEHGDLYRNHLLIARWIKGWRERLNEDSFARSDDHRSGTDYALGEISAHLEQGDFLPTGQFILDTLEEHDRR